MTYMFKFGVIVYMLITLTIQVIYSSPNATEFMEFLFKNNYTNGIPIRNLTSMQRSQAIIEFKKLVHLPKNDKITIEAEKWMNMARCGKPNNPKQRYKLNQKESIRWPKNHLTYKLKNYPRNEMPKNTAIREIEKAFEVWSQVANISFKLVTRGKVDIEIEFIPTKKGDGKGKTIAYAYFPTIGDVYFDDENWTADGKYGLNLLKTAAHEFGHSLGLDHSYLKDSLMYPYILKDNILLSQEDINRIQDLYGPSQQISKEKTCILENMDNIFTVPPNYLYVVKNRYCWKYKNEILIQGYPKLITVEWPNTFYLYQHKYWRSVDGEKFTKVDAAFVMDGVLHIFKGDNFCRFSTSSGKEFDNLNCRPGKLFLNGSPLINAAYYDGKKYVYLFTSKLYYKYDKSRMNVKYAVRAQPISKWFGCSQL